MSIKKILHPKNNDTVKRDFVAFGTSERKDTKKVTGKLIRMEGETELLVSEGKTILQPNGKKGLWAVLFENVAEGKDYTLVVTPDDPPTTPKKSTISVKDRANKRIDIIHAATNGSVCNDFIAYGTTTNTSSSVTGSMTNTAGTSDGTTILQPTSRGSWAIQFTTVPNSGANKYKLHVENAAGNNDENTDITVVDTEC